jgi:hypothetical protein
MEPWPFEDTPKTASITTRQVLEGAPVLHVTHDADDGSWQFLCGTTDDPADARVVGLGRMYQRDPSLGSLPICRKVGKHGERPLSIPGSGDLRKGEAPRPRARLRQ